MMTIKAIFLASIVAFLSACNGFDEDLLQNPNAPSPEKADLNDLYNSIQLSFLSFYNNAQYTPGAAVRMYHAAGFSYRAFADQNTFNALWLDAYAGLFPDVDAIVKIHEAEGSQFNIHIGSAKVLKAYTMMVLVDLFGPIPFSEAGNGTDIISPKLDAGMDVYMEAMELLDEAMEQLKIPNSPDPAFDNFYNGNPVLWIKAANSIKMRAALNMGDRDMFISILNSGNFISSEVEDFQWNFGSKRANPNSRHPFYNNHYESLDGDYLSNYYMWLLRGDKVNLNGALIFDPRTRYYFYRQADIVDSDCTIPDHYKVIDPRLPCGVVGNGYMGRDHLNGEGIPPDGPFRTRYGLYPYGGDFDDDTFDDTKRAGLTGGRGQGIWPIMTSSFIDFIRAEAAITLVTGEDPRILLESGIRKSMAKVVDFEVLVSAKMGAIFQTRDPFTVRDAYGMDQNDMDRYVTEVLAIYDSPESNQLDIVIKEYYVASWGNGLEAYNMYRRTGCPENLQPGVEPAAGGATDPFPRSFLYPSVAINRNSSIKQKKTMDVAVFWDPMKNVY